MFLLNHELSVAEVFFFHWMRYRYGDAEDPGGGQPCKDGGDGDGHGRARRGGRCSRLALAGDKLGMVVMYCNGGDGDVEEDVMVATMMMREIGTTYTVLTAHCLECRLIRNEACLKRNPGELHE